MPAFFLPTSTMSKSNLPSKRTLTLDLNAPSSKKARVQQILTSPDVQMLKLTSPELAEFLTRNPTLATPTPSGGYLFPKNVTEEQEMYAKGFEEALKNMQNTTTASSDHPSTSTVIFTTASGLAGQNSMTVSTPAAIEIIEKATANYRANMAAATAASSTAHVSSSASELSASPRPSSGASGSMDSSDNYGMVGRIKEEDPEDEEDVEEDDDEEDDDDYELEEELKRSKKRSSRRGMAVSPIDMASQEKIKLERKRLRNRLAASKCRKRKLERIAQLDVKVKDLKGENSDLANVVKKLKETVYNLKQEVLEHANSGCQISMVEENNFS